MATALSHSATAQRRCPRCASGMALACETRLSRRYACVCGFETRLLTGPTLLGMGLVGSLSALGAGRAWFDEELIEATLGGLVMIAVLGFLLQNLWLRQRCPRVP